MIRPGSTGERLVFVFVLGLVAFNPPLLSVFSVPEFVLGIPLLYLYLFAAWAVQIALLALIMEGGDKSDPHAGGPSDRRH